MKVMTMTKSLIRFIIEFLVDAVRRIPKKRTERKRKKELKKISWGEYFSNAKERAEKRRRPKIRKVEIDENPYE